MKVTKRIVQREKVPTLSQAQVVARCKAEQSSPTTADGLRVERDGLRRVRQMLKEGACSFTCHAGGSRRLAISEILLVCAHPERVRVSPDLLLAAQMLLAYNDKVAVMLLKKVDADYNEDIRVLEDGEIPF